MGELDIIMTPHKRREVTAEIITLRRSPALSLTNKWDDESIFSSLTRIDFRNRGMIQQMRSFIPSWLTDTL